MSTPTHTQTIDSWAGQAHTHTFRGTLRKLLKLLIDHFDGKAENCRAPRSRQQNVGDFYKGAESEREREGEKDRDKERMMS